MLAFLFKSLLIVSILLSSVGGEAVNSATLLPDSPMYPIKMLLEQARLSMTNDSAKQAELHLAFAQERAEEMAGLAARNQAPSTQLMANYQAHWREALQLAGQMPDEELQPLMNKAQHMANVQEGLLACARVGATNRVREQIQDAQGCLAQVQAAVSLGLQSRNTFRWQIQNVPEEWPGEGEGFSPGPGYGPGPGGEEAPYGPGDGECPNPGECDGEGPYGPGGGECPNPGECDGEGPYGPGNDDPGPNGPANEDPGPNGPGNEEPGPNGPGNEDPGNDDPGGDNPGNEDPGNDDPGSDNPGNEDPGSDDPGNDDPGSDGGSGNTGHGGNDGVDGGGDNTGGDNTGGDNSGGNNSGDGGSNGGGGGGNG
jgi:uncharacterized membrane protein YgcG